MDWNRAIQHDLQNGVAAVRTGTWVLSAITLLCQLTAVDRARAQQVTIGAPLINAGSSYSDGLRFGFGMQYVSPGGVLFFRNGNAGLSPADTFSFGMGGRRGGWSWDFSVAGGQGHSRQLVGTSPMLTVPNGGFGFIQNGVQRPFVTSFVPVVGDRHSRQLASRFQTAVEQVRERRNKESRIEERRVHTARVESLSARESRAPQPGQPSARKTLDPPLLLRGSSSAERGNESPRPAQETESGGSS